MKKFNFSYDKEKDDLFLFNPKSKSKGSVEIGDVVLDYNNKKELVGIQIINASKLLKNISNEKITIVKSILSSLKECKLDIKQSNNLVIIKFYLLGKKKEISPILSVPNIKESSPALAYV